MFTVGLTGGIASGKSTVAKCFEALGIETLDSDQIAREAVLPETSAFKKIVERFGPKILLEDGHLDRRQLRQRIFDHRDERVWLEELLHPIIQKITKEKLAHVKSPYAILQIPLLIGRPKHPLVNRILLVDAPDEVRLKRLQNRDTHTVEEAEAMIKAQLKRDQLLAGAEDVIVNEHAFELLDEQVHKYHKKYLALAKKEKA